MLYDLVLVYLNGKTEVAQYNLTAEEIDVLSKWYRNHSENIRETYGQAVISW